MRDKSRPLLSCIIPSRNERAGLEITVRSLVPALKAIVSEIIVVDDCSEADLHVEQIGFDSAQQPQTRVSYHRTSERSGAARARNFGASHAQGRYLLFLDAHVVFSAGAVTRLLEHLTEQPRMLVGAATAQCSTIEDLAFFGEHPERIPGAAYFGWDIGIDPKPYLSPNYEQREKHPFPVSIVGAASMMLSSELFHELGGFEDELSGSGNLEDSELCLRAWANACTVKVDPGAVCCHFDDPSKDKTPHPESPYIIPWYQDCEKNLFRFSFLHLPIDIHERYFKIAPDGTDLEALCVSPALVEHQRRIASARGVSRRGFFRALERLREMPRATNERHGVVASDLGAASFERRAHPLPLIVLRSDALEALTRNGERLVFPLGGVVAAGYGSLYSSQTESLAHVPGLSAEWADMFHQDVVAQYVAPWLYLSDRLAQTARALELGRLSAAGDDPMIDAAVALANRKLEGTL